MNTLSLTMIVKNEQDTLDRILCNANIYADEIVVVDTGSTDKTIEIAKKYTNKIYNFKWCNDFSKARNFWIDKCTKDYIIWHDADDVMKDEDCEKLNSLKQLWFWFDVWYIKRHRTYDKNWNSIMVLNREKIFRNNKWIYFKYPIHECLNFCDWLKYNTDLDINVYHKKIKWHENSIDRNITILEENISKDEYKNSNRFWWQLWKEYKALNNIEKAIEMILNAVNLDASYSCKANQYYDLWILYQKINDIDNAIKNFWISIWLNPILKEPYFKLWEIYFNQKKYKESLRFFLICENIPSPNISVENMQLYNWWIIYDWISILYEKIWDYDKSYKYIKKAIKYDSSNQRLIKNKKIIYNLFKNSKNVLCL